MSSILTNQGAMTALQTLKSINKRLSDTREMVATGKRVNSARDNAAVWAISKTMESDVAGFARIKDSLNLGQSSVAVARKGSETVVDLLTQMKEKIVASQEENVDRDKIQADISALRDQIGAVVGAAQFNGLNLLKNTSQTENSGAINVLASLDRASDGVRASDIRVRKQDLGMGLSSIGTGLSALAVAANDITGFGDAATGTLTGAATAPTGVTTFGSSARQAVTAGTGFSITISGSTGDAPANTSSGNEINYVARDGDTMADVSRALAAAYNRYVEASMGATATGGITAQADGNTITFTGAGQTGADFAVQVDQYAAHASSTIGGGLSSLSYIDVSSEAGADAALADIDRLLETAIDASASFGSSEMRLETQTDFISGLSSALKSGIGTLVDADMEETAAALQALQVQQQLSVTSLSIANQSPQYLLQLFR
ncbi:flagellin [Sagittula sp. S175]|uniref:flagellin N-terminal helical domain-containing protein n=1 Tax=Sagittula sp. S175 TaxID=3415129 RepID=UPI003C79CC12